MIYVLRGKNGDFSIARNRKNIWVLGLVPTTLASVPVAQLVTSNHRELYPTYKEWNRVLIHI